MCLFDNQINSKGHSQRKIDQRFTTTITVQHQCYRPAKVIGEVLCYDALSNMSMKSTWRGNNTHFVTFSWLCMCFVQYVAICCYLSHPYVWQYEAHPCLPLNPEDSICRWQQTYNSRCTNVLFTIYDQINHSKLDWHLEWIHDIQTMADTRKQ